MERIPAQKARRDFSRVLGRVAYGDEVAIITKNGSDHVAMISIDAFKHYEAMEDYIDWLETTKIQQEMEEKCGKKFDEILAKYGLTRDDL